ncbi:beta-galactosidase 11 [Triticum aestivum]|uniref:beta-galactosidase 11 n=1 Tax=Triticum aestivum TaxID=4565 RepID=UPI001D01D251|nr:beta-galactosidase 11 [Triticum aestivum]
MSLLHYPRSPFHEWPDLIARAKEGGLNVIESYVFWNVHEPEIGMYNFEGRYDMVKFFKLIQEHEMFSMRIASLAPGGPQHHLSRG